MVPRPLVQLIDFQKPFVFPTTRPGRYGVLGVPTYASFPTPLVNLSAVIPGRGYLMHKSDSASLSGKAGAHVIGFALAE